MCYGHDALKPIGTTRTVGKGPMAVHFPFSEISPVFRPFRCDAARRTPFAATEGFLTIVLHFLNRQTLFVQQLPDRQVNRFIKSERTWIMYGDDFAGGSA